MESIVYASTKPQSAILCDMMSGPKKKLIMGAVKLYTQHLGRSVGLYRCGSIVRGRTRTLLTSPGPES